MPNVVRTSCAISAAFLLVFASVSPDAFAFERKRSGSYQTAKGKTGTYQTQVERGGGHVSRDQSFTTQDGKTYNREVDRTYDKTTGAYTSTVTNPQGNTRTTTGTVAPDGTRTGTVTGSGGKTAEVSGSTVRNPDGSVTRNTTLTGSEGNTVTRSATTDYDQTTGTVNRTVTGPGGNTRSGSVTTTPDAPQ